MPPGRGGAIQTSHIGTQSSPREAPAAPARAASAMTDFLLANEPALRLAFFFGALAALMVAEAALPRRRREIPRLTRWSGNLGVVAVDPLLLSPAFPVVPVGFAALAEQCGWGLLNNVDAHARPAFLAYMLGPDPPIYLNQLEL